MIESQNLTKKLKMILPLFDRYNSIKNRQTSNSNSISRQNQTKCFHFFDLEIKPDDVDIFRNGICAHNNTPIHLFKYHEVPDFLQGNPYVKEGYRSMLSFSMCMKSLFIWSNETLNIWSHLGGFILFVLMALHDNLIILPRLGSSVYDHIILTIGLSCYTFCMLCSSGFHIFCCHSEKACRRWLAVDMTGVSIGIIGCYLPGVYYAFYCLSIWRDIYLFTMAILSVFTMIFQLHPKFFTRTWFHIRLCVYVGLTAYGIIPAVHWIYLNGGFSSHIVQIFFPKVVMVYILGGLAFTIYLSKLPEKMFPGLFDYVGSSHQLWHVMIVVAFTYWHQAGQEILLYRLENQCPI